MWMKGDEDIPKLGLNRPILHDGWNVVIRRGMKWSYVDQAIVGGQDVPVFTRAYVFREIPVEDLKMHHNTSCRELSGLFRKMQRVYGEDFSQNEVVTIIKFYYTED